MGTWGAGLYDGDAPLDFVYLLTEELQAEVAQLAERAASEGSAGSLAGLLGLLLQLGPSAFPAPPEGAIGSALTAQAPAFDALGPQTAKLLKRIANTGGQALAKRKGKRSRALKAALGNYLNGRREPALFEHLAAQAVVQRFADRCLTRLEEGLEGLDDLHRTEELAALGVLLLIEPCLVSPARLRAARAQLEAGWTAHQARGEGLEFFTRYVANARAAFDLAQARFGDASEAEVRAAQATAQKHAAQAERASQAAAAAAAQSATERARARRACVRLPLTIAFAKKRRLDQVRDLFLELASVIAGTTLTFEPIPKDERPTIPDLTHALRARGPVSATVLTTHTAPANPVSGCRFSAHLECQGISLDAPGDDWTPEYTQLEWTFVGIDLPTFEALHAALCERLGQRHDRTFKGRPHQLNLQAARRAKAQAVVDRLTELAAGNQKAKQKSKAKQKPKAKAKTKQTKKTKAKKTKAKTKAKKAKQTKAKKTKAKKTKAKKAKKAKQTKKTKQTKAKKTKQTKAKKTKAKKAKQTKAKQTKAKQTKAKQTKAKQTKAKQTKAKQTKAKQTKAKQAKRRSRER